MRRRMRETRGRDVLADSRPLGRAATRAGCPETTTRTSRRHNHEETIPGTKRCPDEDYDVLHWNTESGGT